jgi:formate dehydrogenase major subunit
MRRRTVLEYSGAGLVASWLTPALAIESVARLALDNPWRTFAPPNRLLAAQYRAPGAGRFAPTTTVAAWNQIAGQLVQVRAASWSNAARRAGRLGFFLGTDLTNEEAYTWAKIARLVGARLERQHERTALAAARAFETTFGQPAAPNHWLELETSRSILVLGDTSPTYPAYEVIAAARAKGARLWQASGEAKRSLGGTTLELAPFGDLAFLGGLIRYLIDKARLDPEYLVLHTNAAFRLVQDFSFQEGRFSGFDARTRRYDPQTWSYEFEESGRPARSKQLEEEGTVFSQLVRFFAPYTLANVSRATGLAESALERFYREFTDPERRPAAIVYALEPNAPASFVEQKLRAAAIASLLMGQVGRPGGGLVLLAPGWNPQGTADVGALGASLPGYSGAPPEPGEDFIRWIQRNGLRNERRLIALLRSWYDTPQPDFGFGSLGCAEPGESLSRADLDMLVVVGADPLALGDWKLDRLKTLVVLSPDATNRSARFWEQRKGNRTEVYFLPLAVPAERGGTLTDSGRRIVLVKPQRAPAGRSENGLTLAFGLWSAIQRQIAKSEEPRDQGLRTARAFAPPEVAAIVQEMAGDNLGDPQRIDRAERPQELRCAVSVYAGLSAELLEKRLANEDPSRLGLYPGFGYTWPADIHVLGNRASCDVDGKSRIEPALVAWDGKAWSGADTPDVVDIGLSPEEPATLRAFRNTPEGVARLFAASYAGGLNLDTGVAFNTAPLLTLGPLPAFYLPWGSRRRNPILPQQSEPPVPPA